ncbi:protein CURLY FLAG LEAF 2 isoform X3 [Cryptomeria japonica]|uniref:protein CURLY FLAG LEAF 2 isoform X3 n=1 Tax=Cryptomeria japonica TaxID=3369 RepID=UPI0027DA480C|nr:protein CURLY FLAG LEAF 2 isoform X3 [Cryptomeria japonica]
MSMDVDSANKNIVGWGSEGEVKVSELTLRHFNDHRDSTALHLYGRSTRNSSSSSSSSGSESIDFDPRELGQEQCFSSAREKSLDLKSGEVYYPSSEEATETSSEVFSIQESSKFSSIEEEDENEGRLDLAMNLSISKTFKSGIKMNDDIATEEAESAAMKLIGCLTCLMYFMVSGQDLKCPKCKGSALLDFPE